MMNKLFRSFVVLFLFILLIFGLIGCENNSDIKDNTTNKSYKSGEVLYPVTITDSFDNEVILKKEPKKIISVAPNITEMVYKLGAEDKLVGRTDYCDYPEEVSTIDSIGTLSTPNIEKIISLEPDLVITSTHFDKENATKLEAVGINVISLYEEYNVDGVYDMIRTLGTALNKQDKATKIVSEMKDKIKDVTDSIKGLEQPTVYYVVGYGEYGDFSAPENTFIGELIKMSGGDNIIQVQDSWSYNLESLLEKDPEIIIVRNGDKEGFETAEGYKELTAVKEGNVYEIDNNLIERQGYRNAEGIMTLARIFHPEAFEQ
ncbi:MAG: helical backbone metal receptor [Clostridium sp.]|nr:helical backbone metal receptor [Clostridium sp.]